MDDEEDAHQLEAGDASVSVDLMIRSLLSVGAGPADIAKIIRSAEPHKAAQPVRDEPRGDVPVAVEI